MSKDNHKESAEEVLDKYYVPRMHWKAVNRQNVIDAMKSFAKQEVDKANQKQRDICADEFVRSWHSDDQTESDTEHNIRTAPSPKI